MDKPSTEVVRFALQQKPRGELEPIDQAGHAVVGLLKDAADISKENIERAMTVAHRLSLELRTAGDRIRELEAEVERLESRATRAEQWLGTIKKEIEDTLIAPMEGNRSKPQMLN
jgi:chromosome segregation ATPase